VFLFFLDASAVGKRYVPEMGSSTVNHLFDRVPHDRLVMLTQTLGETLSIIVRRRNGGKLTDAAYRDASQTLRDELIVAAEVQFRGTDDALVFASLPLIEQHSINSTDALVLRASLELEASLQSDGHSIVLVASDVRLLRAAAAESLAVFNPETEATARLAVLIDAS
jgi:uncharacterized protein